MFMKQSSYKNQFSSRYTEFCETVGSSIYPMQFQQNEVENIEMPRHICPVCDKTFRASSLLDIHMRVHVGAKPFVCPVCNHRATQKGNLKLHMKKHHGLDLPSHIDLVPDSGIWGSFPEILNSDDGDPVTLQKTTTLAHSSLLNENVIELIKKFQNNIGQSTMGRITESLKDFLDVAQQKVLSEGVAMKTTAQNKEVSENSNNNAMKLEIMQPPGQNTLVQNSSIKNGDQLPESHDIKITSNSNLLQKQYCYCKICGWKTTSTGYLNVHMRKHKAESHICTICGRAFKETWYLKNHMRSHVNDFACDAGNRIKNSLSSSRLACNTQAAHNLVDEKIIHEKTNDAADCSMCSKCGLVFPKLVLSTHLKVCGNPQKLDEDCNLWDKVDKKSAFMLSLQLKAGLIPKPEKENVCSFDALIGSYVVCSLPRASDNHDMNKKTAIDPIFSLKKAIETSTATYRTTATKKSFEELLNNPDFNILISAEHIDSVTNLLDTNQANTTSDISLRNSHNSIMKSDSNLSFMNKPFQNEAMKSLANIGKSLRFSKTSKVMEGDTRYRPYHNGFKCQFCPKWFKYRSILGIHMRSHTGERPYKCAFCCYAGTQHNCLKLHMQRHHPIECANYLNSLPAKASDAEEVIDIDQEHMLLEQAAKFTAARCPICSRVSPSPGYLKIHMRSHKKTLDHVCHVCGRGFKEYWYLSTHLRTHDQEINVLQTFEKPNSPNCVMDAAPLTKTALHKSLLSKQHSLPVVKPDINQTGHACVTEPFSWCPTNAPEKQSEENRLSSQRASSEPTRRYVSKRKAFLPARHVEPYPTQETTRSRKSKPRKLIHGTYLSPVFQELPCLDSSQATVEEVDNGQGLCNEFKSTGEDQPLDLSVSVAAACKTWSCAEMSDADKPLNLAIKN